ncbi:MAG TPA: retropepsin-like aspartic protease [Clostridia bacterium]
MNINSRYGLPFIEVELIHKDKSVKCLNFLVDTGSASTVLAAEIAVQLDLGPEPNDVIREIRGVGGTEFVYEKYIDRIILGSKHMDNFKIQIGDMDYGFDMDGIIGYNFLKALKVLINFDEMEIE